MKKLIILMLALMLFLSNGICVFAKEENIMARKAWIKKIDKVLENANVPESVIREMDDEFKEFIYENSGDSFFTVVLELSICTKITPSSLRSSRAISSRFFIKTNQLA